MQRTKPMQDTDSTRRAVAECRVRLPEFEGKLRAVADAAESDPPADRAASPNAAAFRRACEVIEASAGLGMLPVDVTTTAASGFALWYRTGRHYAVLECDNDGDIAFLGWLPGTAEPETWMIGSSGELEETLLRIGRCGD